MSKARKLLFHALIEKEGRMYSALCLELNVASQGKSVREAKANLREAVELYLEDVYEAGDEADFVPRPAPVEEWLKYFKAEAKQLGRQIKGASVTNKIEFDEMVYA
jgi:predicted RNase H-like HicB family nuclease